MESNNLNPVQPLNKIQVMNQLAQSLSEGDVTREVVGILKNSAIAVVTRAHGNLEAMLQEGTANSVSQFMETVGNRLTDTTQEWLDQASGNLVVFPEGTRFVNRDDNTLTVVVEQKPTQRRIAFRSAQQLPNGRWEPVVRNFFLSLPFVHFIATFHRSRKNYTFSGLKVVCTKTPLQSVNDKAYALPLPNVHTGHQVCTGGDHGMELPEGRDSVMNKMNTLISEFWQTQFNTDLSTNMVLFLQRNFGFDRIQAAHDTLRMELGMAAWGKMSIDNPMFMLEDNTNLGHHIAFGRLLENDVTSRGGRTAFKNRMKQEIQNGIGNVSRVVTDTIRGYNLIDENRDKVHIDALRPHYQSIVQFAWSSLYNLAVQEQNKNYGELRKDIDRRANELDSQSRKLDRDRTQLQNDQQQFVADRNRWAAEKSKREQELINLNAYLTKLKAELEAGVRPTVTPTPSPTPAPAPAPAPARPTRIPPAPGRSSNRGRPRKTAVKIGSISRIRGVTYVWNGSEWLRSA